MDHRRDSRHQHKQSKDSKNPRRKTNLSRLPISAHAGAVYGYFCGENSINFPYLNLPQEE